MDKLLQEQQKHFKIKIRCNFQTPTIIKQNKKPTSSLEKYFFSEFVLKDNYIFYQPIYRLLRQHKNFEWTFEHQKCFDENKPVLSERISITILDPNQPFHAMSDASSFAIGASFSQSHQSTNENEFVISNL